MGFVFSEVEDGECILIPGNVVVMERLERNSLAMTKNGLFVAFARSSLRFTKTDRWAIAVNTSSEVVKDVSFNIASVGASLWGEWSTSSLISRSGPVPVSGALHPTGIEGADQTIFVRSIALRSPESFFDERSFMPSVKHLKTKRISATIRSVIRRLCGRGTRGRKTRVESELLLSTRASEGVL